MDIFDEKTTELELPRVAMKPQNVVHVNFKKAAKNPSSHLLQKRWLLWVQILGIFTILALSLLIL